MRDTRAGERPHSRAYSLAYSLAYSTPSARSWQGRLLVSGFLLLLTAVYFWPQIVQGRVLYWGDIGLYFAPMEGFLRENLRAGRVPLWNPLIYCGTPYAGNPQAWPLYPVTALLPFVSASYFLSLTVALHVWLAGVGTFLFARRALGVGRVAALLAAITFMFGGQLVSKEQFPNMVQASAWLPWVLWALDGLLRGRRVRNALVLGLVLGLQLLAAHAQMTLLTLYLAVAWGVFVLRREGAPKNGGAGKELGKRAQQAAPRPAIPLRLRLPQDWGRGGLLLLSGVVAVGLAAGQILPAVALFRDASRQKLSFHVVNRFFLPDHQLGNFVLPHLHGNPYWGDWTARGNFWETCCYVGWLSFGLALWGGVQAWRKGGMTAARFWTGVFGFGLWMALGGKGGLYYLAYFVLPGFRAFHDPARCLLWACFALSLLAGYGWERIAPPAPKNGGAGKELGKRAQQAAPLPAIPLRLRLPQDWGRGGLLLLLAFADLTHFGRTLYPLADAHALSPVAPNVALALGDPDVRAHQARVLAPTEGVWLRFTNYKDFRQNVPGYQTLWADTLTPNLTMRYGLLNAYGYEPVALKDAQTTDGKASSAFDPKAKPRERAEAASQAGALGVKYVAVCRIAPPEKTTPGLVAVRAAPTLSLPGHTSGPQAQVYLSRNARWQPRARLEGSAAPVTVSDDGPDRVTLTCVTTGPAPLVLADTSAAGWRTAVDGRAARIETYGGSLRVVRLSGAGAHTVVFSYVPTPYLVGLYLSLLTLAGLAGAGTFAAARNFARRGESRGGIGGGGVE